MTPLSQLKNLSPQKCKRFLIKNGWESINREGSHETFRKMGDNGKWMVTQIIWNNKTVYPKNAQVMIDNTNIPASEWIKNCK